MNSKTKLYESAIASMSEGVLVFDMEGGILLKNERAVEMLKLKEKGAEFSLVDLMADEEQDYTEFADAVFSAIYQSDIRINNSISFGTGQEEKRFFLSTGCLKDEEGNTEAVMAVINDITEVEKLHETFGRYVSNDVARALLASPDGLSMGGVSREVTILMSDLRGFTVMCERLPAESIVSILNHYFAVMNDMIEKYHGTVIEFLGDGMFVVFGAPLPDEKHAANAVAAAVSMQKAMRDINLWNEEQGFPRLAMGIGINSGEVVVGNIGCEKRTKYGVLGNQVNLSGRIESYTTAGQILISPTTRALISEELVVEQEAEVLPKGVDKAILLTQVIGIGGDYDVSYEMVHEPLTSLKTPYITTYKKLTGKHVSTSTYLARITKLSTEQVFLKTKEELQVFDNIRLDLAGETYAKVIRREKGGWICDLTAPGAGFFLWIEEIRP